MYAPSTFISMSMFVVAVDAVVVVVVDVTSGITPKGDVGAVVGGIKISVVDGAVVEAAHEGNLDGAADGPPVFGAWVGSLVAGDTVGENEFPTVVGLRLVGAEVGADDAGDPIGVVVGAVERAKDVGDIVIGGITVGVGELVLGDSEGAMEGMFVSGDRVGARVGSLVAGDAVGENVSPTAVGGRVLGALVGTDDVGAAVGGIVGVSDGIADIGGSVG